MKLPIRLRLTVVYCVVFCACMLALESGAYIFLSRSVDSLVERELHARLAGVVNFIDEHIARRTPARFKSELESHGALQPELLAILDSAKGVVYVSQTMKPVITAGSPSIKSHLRILKARRTIQGRDLDLYLAADIAVPAEMLGTFRWLLLLSAPVILACASLAGYWISGRALAPVSQLIRAARTIGAGNLSQRVTRPASGDEIEELAVTLNGMLTRIENAFRQMTQFTADASHELRTPLAIIRATSEVALLSPTGDAESYREALHRILSEAEKNTILLDNLLRLARADAATGTVTPKPLSLAGKLAQAGELIQLLAREKNVTLHLRADDAAPPDCAGDPDQVLRLCLILLDNAIKYTPPGGSVTASAIRTGSVARLEVRDNGIGISHQDQSKIFDRFFRADLARSKGAGSGLGLAIADWIIKAHHAVIRVESTLGHGSTFTVDFPALPMETESESFTVATKVQPCLD